MQDCEKKLIVWDSKNVFTMLIMVHELADIGQSLIAKYDIFLGGCLCCTFSNS